MPATVPEEAVEPDLDPHEPATERETDPRWLDYSLNPEDVTATQEWLSTCGHTPTLVLFPRPTEDCRKRLGEGTLSYREWINVVHESARHQFEVIKIAVKDWADKHNASQEWNSFIEFPSIHCCAIRRPVAHLRELLTSSLFEPANQRGIIAHVSPNVGLRLPEIVAMNEEDRKKKVKQAREAFEKQIKAFGGGNNENDYLDSLGVGDFSDEWAGPTDARGCVLDTGADESHVALQQRIMHHALFDPLCQGKKAPDSLDRGCHGSKMVGVICAKTLSGANLGVPERLQPLRLGVCPYGKVALVNVAQGEVFSETSVLTQLLGGMDWAITNCQDPDHGGYEVVNISLELASAKFAPQATKVVDRALEQMLGAGLFPVLAAGNGAGLQLGTKGRYIAPRTDNRPSNSFVELTAPGSLMCCQPPIEQLAFDQVSLHAGSSQASAFVTGVLMQLSGRANRSVRECYEALVKTRKSANFGLDPAAAFRLLSPS